MRRALIGLAVGTITPADLEGVDLPALDQRVQALGLEAHALRSLNRAGGALGGSPGTEAGGRAPAESEGGEAEASGPEAAGSEASEPEASGPEAAGEAFDDPLLSSWLRELRERVRARAEGNRALDRELAEGVDRLMEGGVPVILLGGAALRREFESMIGRPLDRVRLMVPRSRMAEAGSILEASGFESHEPAGSRASEGAGDQGERTGGQGGEAHSGATRRRASYRKGDLAMDLCWQPTDEVPPGLVERCWDRSRPLDDGSGLRLLAVAHRVACGVVEAAERDLAETLLRLGDLALEFPLPESEEQELVREARGWPSRIVHGPLWLLGRWGVPVPRSLTQPVRIRWWEAGLTRRVLERVVVGDGLSFLPHGRLVSAAHRWLARSGSMIAALLHSAERRVRRL